VGQRAAQREPAQLVRELYAAENNDKLEPSGSQDMAGIIYPGINRLDYDASFEGGYFPVHVESNNDPDLAAWLEDVIHILPVAQRPDGYSPLGIKNWKQTGSTAWAAQGGIAIRPSCRKTLRASVRQ